MICKKHCESPTLRRVQACKTTCPLDEKLETAQRTWPSAFDFALS